LDSGIFGGNAFVSRLRRDPISASNSDFQFWRRERINGVYRLEGVIANEANLWVTADVELKLEALRLHASQFRGLDPYRVFPREIAEHLLGNEYFYAEILTED
jgi:LmbE family N-acetylglucosaminyl deacetylase